MNEMPTRDDQAAPTKRSAELFCLSEGDLASARRPRSRPTPEVAVVSAPPPALSGWPPPPAPTASLISEVAREVATTIFGLALGAARIRWS
jgi:hypothetical protein